MSLKPNPPFPFSSQSFSHFTQCTFLLVPSYPHQNFLIGVSNSLINPLGSLKQLIVYVGMAWMTDLIKISLPAWERSFSFHPCNFLHTLSLM